MLFFFKICNDVLSSLAFVDLWQDFVMYVDQVFKRWTECLFYVLGMLKYFIYTIEFLTSELLFKFKFKREMLVHISK